MVSGLSFVWWLGADSNRGPRDYETLALMKTECLRMAFIALIRKPNRRV